MTANLKDKAVYYGLTGLGRLHSELKIKGVFFGVVQTRITDPWSLGSWSNRETEESLDSVGLTDSLIRHDPNDWSRRSQRDAF